MPSDEHLFHYPGTAVDVTWDRRLCIHVGECTRAAGGLFQSGRRPWAEPDRADADTVTAVVARCPTGALTAVRSDGAPAEPTPTENAIVVANCGPLFAYGDLHIAGAPSDMPGVRTRAALCRCGRSQNKPFCDNSHEEAAFRDHGAVRQGGAEGGPAGGPLTIAPQADGPLVLDGNVTLIAGHGRPAWRGARTALCRCGASANKPFCDGSHATTGFTSG